VNHVCFLTLLISVNLNENTSWFRHPDRWKGLERYFKWQCGELELEQMELNYEN
jgi:hypothetical protein